MQPHLHSSLIPLHWLESETILVTLERVYLGIVTDSWFNELLINLMILISESTDKALYSVYHINNRTNRPEIPGFITKKIITTVNSIFNIVMNFIENDMEVLYMDDQVLSDYEDMLLFEIVMSRGSSII